VGARGSEVGLEVPRWGLDWSQAIHGHMAIPRVILSPLHMFEHFLHKPFLLDPSLPTSPLPTLHGFGDPLVIHHSGTKGEMMGKGRMRGRLEPDHKKDS
jgi:hypothetical protein